MTALDLFPAEVDEDALIDEIAGLLALVFLEKRRAQWGDYDRRAAARPADTGRRAADKAKLEAALLEAFPDEGMIGRSDFPFLTGAPRHDHQD